jgi:His-Xaa-Ser system radical SAM maturase HxsB
MDISTAKGVVDKIFESPSENIIIEFQGGEPLVNFDTVKFIVEYAQQKNKTARKKLLISLVTNLTFMTPEYLEFFVKNNVTLCTSLDGNELLHNKNRASKINSYQNTIRWIKRIQGEIKKSKKYKYRINALTTITKSSLSYHKEIVDEFINLGLEGVHLRPVNPFGINKKIWERINFSAQDFLSFYKKTLDYIIELNLKGKRFYERTARILLTKILTDEDPNFLDMRSPCGAGIGQLAYNFNGDVYTCDEARMLSMMDDESYKVGDVFKNSYEDFINNDIVKALCSASCLDNLPGCCECVYKPYCGVCPIYNYVVEGNIFSLTTHNQRCKINLSILDYLFERLQDPQIKDIFYKWVLLGRRF